MAAQDLGPVSIRVPPPGTDADTVIRELVDRAPRPAELIVVTSDKALYSYVKTLGAAVLRAHEWNALERKIAGPRGRRGSDKPEREDDVEGWLPQVRRRVAARRRQRRVDDRQVSLDGARGPPRPRLAPAGRRVRRNSA